MSKLSELLRLKGQMPPVILRITALTNKGQLPKVTTLDTFMSYEFQSDIRTPVDTFTFTFTNPGLPGSLYDYVKEGDIAELEANGNIIATGVIDVVDIEVTDEGGEVVTVTGRDLMCQLEDQTAISVTDNPIWANAATMKQVVGALIQSTKIRGLRLQDAPSKAYLFATEPGETKLAALQRHLEPLNCLAWMDATGNIVIGRPNMAQDVKGAFVVDRDIRNSNVLSMKITRAASQIPNIIVPIWTGQESVVSRVSREQRVYNKGTAPDRLRRLGYLVPKAIVVSTPQGTSAQDLAGITQIQVAGSNLLQAYAKREIARANVNEMIAQVVVPGHYTDNLEPLMPDTTFTVRNPRASVDEKMYVMGVVYSCSEGTGQRTALSLCKLNRIVADISVKTVRTSVVKRENLV